MSAIRIIVSTVIMGLVIYGFCYGMTAIKAYTVHSHYHKLHQSLPMARVNRLYTADNPKGLETVTEKVHHIGAQVIAEDSRIKFFWNQLRIEIHELEQSTLEAIKADYGVRVLPLPPNPPYDVRPSLIFVEVPFRVSFGVVKRVVILRYLTWR